MSSRIIRLVLNIPVIWREKTNDDNSKCLLETSLTVYHGRVNRAGCGLRWCLIHSNEKLLPIGVFGPQSRNIRSFKPVVCLLWFESVDENLLVHRKKPYENILSSYWSNCAGQEGECKHRKKVIKKLRSAQISKREHTSLLVQVRPRSISG